MDKNCNDVLSLDKIKFNFKFPVVEIFKSIEGEGVRSGLPTVFVRFGRCNLSCHYCDTKYANDTSNWKYMTQQEIVKTIHSYNCNRVTFTGGEPLISGRSFIRWFDKNYSKDFEINIETNGSVSLVSNNLDNLNSIITMDYKCKSSGMNQKMCLDNLEQLRPTDVLKFVVSNSDDLEEVSKILMTFNICCKNIFIHPVFETISLQDLAKFVMDYDFLGVRLGIQLHKIIWDPELRGV